VLHVATYASGDLPKVLDDINARGYGLTCGLHSRIDQRIEHAVSALKVGNIYVNRNQIGAVVGSQPFGGEGLSGTGPKAGGPHYVARFCAQPLGSSDVAGESALSTQAAQAVIDKAPRHGGEMLSAQQMPGPTGESNQLRLFGRGRVLCLGPGKAAAEQQAMQAQEAGCVPIVLGGGLEPDALASLNGFDGVVSWADRETAARQRQALAQRDGPIVPLIMEERIAVRCLLERHVCIDTTAAGGNAQLMAAAA
ncbi:MAG: aldehyde dehydrogenase family protein, partial [Pseudomonadota bacterium]